MQKPKLSILKVRPRTGSCSSSISVGGKPLHLSDIQRAEQSMPNLQQRAELLRIAEAMHTSSTTTPHSAGLPLPPNFRSSSQERESKSISLVVSESCNNDCIVSISAIRIRLLAMRSRYSESRFPAFRPRREFVWAWHHLLPSVCKDLLSLEPLRGSQKVSPKVEAAAVPLSNLRKGTQYTKSYQ